MFNEEQMKLLNQELASNRIKTRSKGNVNLSYLEGFDIIETANRVFGFGNWDYSISKLEQVSQEVNQNQNHVVCYKAVVKVLVHDEQHTKDISREDVGFGTGIAKTLADAHEGAAKEAITDSIKRAMCSFGNQFGNSLYSKDKNHQNNQVQNNNQTYQPQSNNIPPQQQQNSGYSPNNQPPQNLQHQAPYQNQQDFTQLTNLGLSVMQQGENLVVLGENVFANKDTIKANGFRWDGQNKTWYMPLRQAA
jgi:DNA repair and recombination protein RAD52